MPSARFQPPALARIRRDLIGRGVGAVFTNSRTEIFGSGADVAMFGNPAQVIAPKHGYARKFVAASSQYAKIAPPAGVIDLAGNFAVVLAFVLDNTATARVIHYSDAANSLNFQIVSLLGRLSVVVGSSSNQYANVSSAEILAPGVPYVAVAGRGPDGYFLHIDGATQPLGGNGGTGIANNVVSADIQIGRRGDGASYFSGQVSLFAHIKGRVDARSLSLNPWQLFQEEEDELHVAIEAAPNSYLLTAGSGGISLAGGAASLRVTRTLAPAAGSFSLAGGAVSVRAARRITAGASAFPLGESSVALRATRRLATGGGAFRLAGDAAALVAGRRLSAGTGTFAVLGQAALLVHTATPAPEGPTYVLTAAPGNFALLFAPAALAVSRRLAGGAGVFGLTAEPARITAARRVDAGPGGGEVAGAEALMQATRCLPTAGGAFALAGADIGLKHSAQIEYARAPAGSGYTPRCHEYQSRPVQVGTVRPSAIQENYR